MISISFIFCFLSIITIVESTAKFRMTKTKQNNPDLCCDFEKYSTDRMQMCTCMYTYKYLLSGYAS